MQYSQDLPFIDEYSEPFDAPPAAVWSALLHTFGQQMNAAERFARLLGCDPSERSSGFKGLPGQTVPGFRVDEADPEHCLVLRGRHRFATYALTFVMDGGTLRAETRAAFPGFLGGLYRVAVIVSGGHRIFTRRLLRHVTRRASRRL